MRRAKDRVRVRVHPFTAYLDAQGAGGKEFLLAIGKRAGKSTVRARTKRILRNIITDMWDRLPEGAVVRITADGDLTELPRKAVRLAAAGLLDRLITAWHTGRKSVGISAGPSSGSSASTKP